MAKFSKKILGEIKEAFKELTMADGRRTQVDYDSCLGHVLISFYRHDFIAGSWMEYVQHVCMVFHLRYFIRWDNEDKRLVIVLYIHD